MKALTFAVPGSPEVLEYKEVNDPVLKPGEILVEMKAIGLNYADIMRRSGVSPMRGHTPYINGFEGAGIVKDSNGHTEFKSGDRVAFADVPFANAELVAVPVTHAIRLPGAISFELAASIMLQGLSAQFLTADSHAVRPGETIVVHAAAGGVGQILIQVCKTMGAKVIGLVSSAAKKEIVQALGADAVFLYSEDWKTKVLELCPTGVDVVYESIGSTMETSLSVTRVLGQVVLFGLAGGTLEVGNPLQIIGQSKTITGGDLWDYLTSAEERQKRSAQLFNWVMQGKIRIAAPSVFKLSEGRKAHEFMEGKQSTGKILMIP
jgi:NADPH:quinone reductase